MRPTCVLLLTLCLAVPGSAEPSCCNPIDLDYRYGFEHLNEGISYRSGADPVIVPHRGEYYMFVTISGGYWRSKDLVHWDFVTPDRWPFEDMCAPAALSVGDKLYLFQSTFTQRPILWSSDPASGHWDWFNRWMPLLKDGPWDPAIFHDDDDRWYMYWGSSNVFPLSGCELDYSRKLAYKTRPQGFIKLHPEHHGWERFGQDHTDPRKPFTEGAWMTKHAGRYYLQYAAPGTEYNVYATGTYVGSGPLGPFRYAPNNPICYRPGGYALGAGHGNTFQDFAGHWYTTGTCWIGYNGGMERRLVLYPSGFDSDGWMYSNTRFGDFPHRLPDLFLGWMLLSYKKPVSASSSRNGFPPSHVTDENLRTFWVPQDSSPWLSVDLEQPCEVRAVQVNYADFQSGLYETTPEVYTTFQLQASLDGVTWQTVADLEGQPRRDRPNAYVELEHPVQARYLKWVHGHVGAPQVAVADIRVFGKSGGPVCATPEGLSAHRDADRRNAILSWKPVSGAVGYNVRWGLRPDKLYQNYQVWADRGARLEIRALNDDQPYSFAVESFNREGVSKLSAVVSVK